MQIETARKVLQTIEAYGKSGCGIISLSNETNIDQSELREFLHNNKDMVSKSSLNGTYTINRFGKHRGSIESMLSELVKKSKNEQQYQYYFIVVIAFTLGLILGRIG